MAIWTVPARVMRVVDGETLIMDLDLGWHVPRLNERCRLRGINSPELDSDAGVAARAFVQDTVWATAVNAAPPEVTFTSTGLNEGQGSLGIVRLSDGRLLNDLILDAGHAVRA
jgi:endonuclease YncB( thermonuclease family)